jgi:two-component system response regulator (stage 0 sporulation protein F)
LVVDDDEADRIVLRTILERANHEVFLAKDGDEALAVYAGKGIEVVITDLQMKNLHGLQLITILRDLSPRPGIIAISGTGEFQLDMARAVGAWKALTKPVTPADLLAAVTEVLGRRA